MNPSNNGRYKKHYMGGSCLQCGRELTAGKVVATHSTSPTKPGHYCVLWADGSEGCRWEAVPEANRETVKALFSASASASKPTSRTEAHPASAEASGDPLTMAIVRAVEPVLAERLKATVDEDRVLELVEQALDQVAPIQRIEVKTPDGEVKQVKGRQHARFPLLLKAMTARDHKGMRLNIWIAGPAGSGKTTAVEKAADALGLPFAFSGAINEVYRLVGFMAPGTGTYISTDFRRAYENGGVFLLDEVDASDPAVVLELNAALANSSYPFPDGMVPRHADFICIAAANTWGMGGTSDYVGRSKMDAAFLNRFCMLTWDYDAELEASFVANQKWLHRVLCVRSAVRAKGIKVVISPRSTIFGDALLSAGCTWEEAEELALRGAMTADQWEAVKGAN